jgi:hypothetical protein
MSNGFNAKKARAITNVAKKNELDDILILIEKEAEEGGSIIYLGKGLEDKTYNELVKRGFFIHELIGKYAISW